MIIKLFPDRTALSNHSCRFNNMVDGSFMSIISLHHALLFMVTGDYITNINTIDLTPARRAYAADKMANNVMLRC